jgi:hypothetical protein
VGKGLASQLLEDVKNQRCDAGLRHFATVQILVAVHQAKRHGIGDSPVTGNGINTCTYRQVWRMKWHTLAIEEQFLPAVLRPG